MNTLKSKLTLASLLLSGSCQALAHTGDHGISFWHHYVASVDHVSVFLLLALSGLGILTYFALKPASNRHSQE
jgi:hypothetical protein